MSSQPKQFLTRDRDETLGYFLRGVQDPCHLDQVNVGNIKFIYYIFLDFVKE